MSVLDVAWCLAIFAMVGAVGVNVGVHLIIKRRRARFERRRARFDLEQHIRALELVVDNHGYLIDAVITGKETEEVYLSSGGLRGWRVKGEPTRTCARCGKSIDGYRPPTIYCGGACRAAASRKRAKP